MKTQEAYNKIRTHLLSMKKRCYSTLSSTCLYNGPDDTHCAVGILIKGVPLLGSDNLRPIGSLIATNDGVRERLSGTNQQFLLKCQAIHDIKGNWTPDETGLTNEGKEKLDELVKDWDLVINDDD